MKKTLLSAVLLVSFSLVLTARAMPPAPGVQLSRAETDERARLGIDVVKRPVRSSGMRDRQNSPGDVTPLVIGTIPFPVVAIKYTDFSNTYSTGEFQNMLFGTWSSGSARDYYHEVSYSRFHMTGTVVGWYTAANNKAYYGYSNGWVRAAMLVKEAAQASDAAVNYTDYDVDGDGYVDAFTCIHAGYGTEESGSGSDIWSHAWSFSGAGIGAYTTNDPRPGYPGQYIRIDDYTTDPERSNRSNYGTMVGIGVYCHEWGHALGLPDLYDTDGGGEGLGNWSLMAGGSWGGNGNSPYYPVHLDPWSRMELGWLCPTAVRSRNLYSIPNIENNAKAYWLMARERTFKEYFLVENRRKTRFDTLLYNSGLLIYHIDDSVIARRRGSNAVNAGGTGWRYGVALEQADGQDHLFSGSNRGDANDPWPGGLGSTTFDSTSTTPNSRTNYPSSATLRTGCLAKNIPASAPTVQCTLGSGLVGAFTGGPDSRGYSWIDSDTTGGPSYTWVDITGTGTMLGSGDDARWSVTLPASYSFYGTGYGTVWVSTNGWLSFGSDPGTNAPANTAVPNSGAPNRAVYAFWDDLNLVAVDSGFVYYQHGGTSPNCSTVVMWKNARIKGASTYNHATFAAVLFQNGRILLRYRDAAVSDTNYNWGRSATVGIEDENGTVGLQYMFNGAPKGNLLANERAIRFASSGAAVRDVGATRVIAPSGTVDSSSSTVPSCSVYNYGTTTESYSVRCRVGSSYNQTATVTGHAPGTRAYVTFAAWVAGQRGTYPVSCSTELSGDAVEANNKAAGSVTVRVPDVGCRALLAPAGTVDSGTAITPACTVYNYGSASATYTVRMKVGSGYNQPATVASHAPGAALYVTFPVWSAGLPRGTYAVSCSTELSGDLNNANDRRTGTVTIGVTDAASVALLAPSGTVDSGAVVTPACTVANYGTTAASFNVRMRIGSTYNQTAVVTNLAPNARAYVTFAGWTAAVRGSNAVSCSTELPGDLVQANNKLTGSVAVRVYDVGCAVLVAPAGTADSGTVVTPACTVMNHGTATETYAVRMRVGTGYSEVATVTNHAAGARLHVTFPAWTAGPRGTSPVVCSTELAADMQLSNDRQTGSVSVRVRDVACTRLVVPAGVVDSGAVITPACSVLNPGTATESYVVRMRIGATYDQTAAVAAHAPGAVLHLEFPAWVVDLPRGSHPASCSTELSGDMQPGNDRQSGLVEVAVHDVGCASILAPAGTVDHGVSVVPACTVVNHGTVAESYAVRLRIGTIYNQAVAVSNHAAGTSRYVTFPAWIADPVGMHAVVCSTELARDPVGTNDRVLDSVFVRASADVGVTRIVAPTGRLDTGAVVVPRATVKNFGLMAADFDVFFSIRRDTVEVYSCTRAVSALMPESSASVLFDTLAGPHLPGSYSTRCSTWLADDINPANDVKTDSFAFFMSSRDTGWSARAPLPGLPSGKAAKNGAWLAHDFGTGFIYAAKGNKTPDFYAYSPVADSWRQLAAMPPGREGKAPGNGATGCADGAGTVYAAKGNNSLGFYRYVAARDSWHQLADVPPGLSGKRVKGGTDAVFVSSTTAGFVYLLKGHKNEFYRYDPVSDSWQTLAAAPAEKWGRGSWLAHMPEGRGSSARAPVPGTDFETGICESGSFTAGVIYAHQAKHHGMYAYDIEAGTWGSNLGGMPSVGRSGRSKMSKDGGSSATLGPAIYAFKGNNSQEFWRFLAPVGPWTELDTLPMTAPGSLKKKKVKAGADLVGYGPWDVLYGLKGNATYEFWCYTPAASTTSAAGMVQSGVTAIGLGSSATRVMTVSPNPLKARIAAIHLNPRFPESSIPVVSIFDAGGRLVRRSVFSTRQSSVTLDLSGLTAGVYLLRLEAGGVAWSEKLVLQR